MQIYKITNKINGKIYIGKDTKNNKSYFGSGLLIKRSIKKYGKENFTKEILEECEDNNILSEKEIYWINYFNSIIPIGYNICLGGDGGDTFTNHPNKEEYLKNKSIASKKMWEDENYRINIIKKRTGLKRTEETKKKMSDSAKDKPKSEEHKKSLSNAWEKRKIEHPHTKETLEKMKNSMLGKNAKNTYKLTDINNNEFIINNLTLFAKENNLTHSLLIKVSKGTRNHHKGWKCEKLN